ncbi:bifunctional phosphoglucose/phosphomannose isomerase [Candidatus Kuenenbacteria bacterium HGW-Kuenenbacteria-1]|uniref:Bifunctional phosphoglucose/phosphomannose isomerase n=1 Tax=Candidatus Kuenenbacteria bacterium HGW-Kuenenbacteria-1 TaxID=2013812 RepID=A0A2N1UNS7_9BACT|nr:MAG: bifunctional phosphoglucose/phosphomannose isomerase [Candidatus Kuenenbacteria bacterium HGW-Kuenenbacteria-1]
MDFKEKIKKYDNSNLRENILNSYKQFEIGIKIAEQLKLKKRKYDKIIISGMGGSAWPGDIIRTFLELKNEIKIPIIVNRDYSLLNQTTKNSLIIISSYSGNTEEAISVYKEILKKKLPMIGFSVGGKLEKICLKDKVPFIKYPDDGLTFQPRFATGYTFSSMLTVFANLEIIKNQSKDILALEKSLKKIIPSLENQGKKLAQKLFNKIPIIYSSDEFKTIAQVWTIKFTENSKILAFWNYFPELNHNEMNGYVNIKGKNFFTIILKSNITHPRILKRAEITAQMIREKGGDVEVLDMSGKNVLEKMFFSIILGDWTSYYLALLNNQDPTPVDMVEDFKKRMT